MIELPVRHHPRRFGKTKYGLTRTIKVILDLFTVKFLISFANKPIYLFGGAGIILIVISAITLLFLAIRRRDHGHPGARLAVSTDEHHVHDLGLSIHLDGLDRRVAGTYLSRVPTKTHLHCAAHRQPDSAASPRKIIVFMKELLRQGSRKSTLIRVIGSILALALLRVCA